MSNPTEVEVVDYIGISKIAHRNRISLPPKALELLNAKCGDSILIFLEKNGALFLRKSIFPKKIVPGDDLKL